MTYPQLTVALDHNLGVIPSRYALQYKSQSAPDAVYLLTGGGVVQLKLDANVGPVSIQYAGPFHLYPAMMIDTKQLKLEVYLVPLKRKGYKMTIPGLNTTTPGTKGADITDMPINAVLSPPGAFRILLWK